VTLFPVTCFLAGMAVGGSLTYAWLWWECRTAYVSFVDELRRKAKSFEPGDHVP
jgi:hypothetical protein